MQKAQLIKRQTRDRPGGHFCNPNSHWWKRLDRRAARRQQKRITAEALLDWEKEIASLCPVCGSYCDNPQSCADEEEEYLEWELMMMDMDMNMDMDMDTEEPEHDFDDPCYHDPFYLSDYDWRY